MKKFLMSLAIASIAMFSYAQEVVVEEIAVPVEKYRVETNRFGANWFISVNGGVNMYYGVVTKGEGIFKHVSPNLSVNFGKWHTPGFGWRAGYTGLSMRSFEGIGTAPLAIFHFDAMFNLTNMCCGYKEDRVYNAIPYVGVGWAGRGAYDYEKWTGLSGTLTAKYGLLNTFRIAKRWAINLELEGYFFRNGFSGRFGFEGHDNMWTVSVGVTYRLGKADWTPAIDVPALQAAYAGIIADLEDNLNNANAQNQKAQGEIANLKNQLNNANKKYAELASKPRFGNVKQSTFFPFGSAKLDSKKEELNIKAYAEAAKAAGVKLRVIGYADATGPEAYNQTLSLQRAEAVAEMLRANGAEVVSVVGQGESSEYNTKYLNRRVIIEAAE